MLLQVRSLEAGSPMKAICSSCTAQDVELHALVSKEWNNIKISSSGVLYHYLSSS